MLKSTTRAILRTAQMNKRHGTKSKRLQAAKNMKGSKLIKDWYKHYGKQ